MDKNKFSVLVPVYNSETYLDKCIESVISQTYSNWELILVDDGSTDRSGDICDTYARKDSRIKAYHKINEGQISARQFAGEKASGNFFIYVDSDDHLKQNALSIIQETINDTNCDCVIYGYVRSINGKSIQRPLEGKTENYTIDNKRELYKKVILDSGYNAVWCKAVRSEILKGMDYSKYYNIKYAEDLLQSLDIYKNCKKITFIPDVLYIYNMNPSSMTHKSKKKEALTDFTVRAKVLEFLQEENVFSEQDYLEYRDFCLKLLDSQISEIAVYPMPISEKKKKFEILCADPYYKEFLLGPDMKYLRCTLLRDGKYNELLLYAKVRNYLAAINNRIKRVLSF